MEKRRHIRTEKWKREREKEIKEPGGLRNIWQREDAVNDHFFREN